jgi:Cytochrome c3
LDFGLKKSVVLLAALAFSISIRVDSPPPQRTNNCVECHKKQSGEVVALYSTSTHAEMGMSCSRCHGGDQSAADKQSAHATAFTGSPDPNGVIAMCGSCHSRERDLFKSSRHFDATRNAPRMDCSQCHGAHGVGSARRDFSFSLYCASCHGLEYLPQLPADFQKMLAALDEQVETLRSIKRSGKPPDDLIAKREEIRRAISDIVHRTDFEGGTKKIPQILKWADEFKRAAEKR